MSKKKIPEQKAIPLRSLFGTEGFQRNYDMLVEQVAHMQTRYTQLSIENNSNGSNKYDGNGLLVSVSEGQIKALEELHAQQTMLDIVKNELLSQAIIGKQYGEQQSEKASHERPTKNHEGETLDGVISRIKQNHLNEAPRDIWVHFKTAIDLWSDGDCKEWGEKDYRSYHYEIDGEAGSIAYSTFRKKLNK